MHAFTKPKQNKNVEAETLCYDVPVGREHVFVLYCDSVLLYLENCCWSLIYNV